MGKLIFPVMSEEVKERRYREFMDTSHQKFYRDPDSHRRVRAAMIALAISVTLTDEQKRQCREEKQQFSKRLSQLSLVSISTLTRILAEWESKESNLARHLTLRITKDNGEYEVWLHNDKGEQMVVFAHHDEIFLFVWLFRFCANAPIRSRFHGTAISEMDDNIGATLTTRAPTDMLLADIVETVLANQSKLGEATITRAREILEHYDECWFNRRNMDKDKRIAELEGDFDSLWWYQIAQQERNAAELSDQAAP
jgi:hypothetical protein